MTIGEEAATSSSSSSEIISEDIWHDNEALKEKTFQRYKAS